MVPSHQALNTLPHRTLGKPDGLGERGEGRAAVTLQE
jgi:hypothetical protein